jgi:uncharacterized DUF497 family protein
MFFLWDDRNIEHLAKHNVEYFEAEFVVRKAKRPYPRSISGAKRLVKGRTLGGRWLQVIYVIRDAKEIDFSVLSLAEQLALAEGESAIYIIHARDLRAGERST